MSRGQVALVLSCLRASLAALRLGTTGGEESLVGKAERTWDRSLPEWLRTPGGERDLLGRQTVFHQSYVHTGGLDGPAGLLTIKVDGDGKTASATAAPFQSR